jgi:hypothetical protein
MSRDVWQRRARSTPGRGSAILKHALLLSISRAQHIALLKQRAAARGPITSKFASGDPSIDGAYFHAAHLRNFALRQ